MKFHFHVDEEARDKTWQVVIEERYIPELSL